jgi:hypothetical protein
MSRVFCILFRPFFQKFHILVNSLYYFRHFSLFENFLICMRDVGGGVRTPSLTARLVAPAVLRKGTKREEEQRGEVHDWSVLSGAHFLPSSLTAQKKEDNSLILSLLLHIEI